MHAVASSPTHAAEMLLEQNYAIIKLPNKILQAGERIFSESAKFFDQSLSVKQSFSALTILEGYRELGLEKDNQTNRPDLSESFTSWFRNREAASANLWSKSCPLFLEMTNSLEVYAEFTDHLLHALMVAIAPHLIVSDQSSIQIRDLSYLQINFSRPVLHTGSGRQNIMDPHEDGHILTILRPTKSGLMICPGLMSALPSTSNIFGQFEPCGEFYPVEIASDEALIVPSSPTYFLTGGLIKPLFHGVINEGHESRQSLMFFVNPTPNTPLSPWVVNDKLRSVDIHQVVESMSGKYGLPDISTISKE